MSNSSPGLYGGLAGLIILSLVTGEAITIVSGRYWHWPFMIAGIVVGLIAARSILK